MSRLKIHKKKEKNIIGKNVKFYIEFLIFVCCLIVTFNIHPTDNFQKNLQDDVTEKVKMKYVFHDYEGNEYVLNDTIHGAASDWSYLFEDDVPEDLKGDNENTVVNSVSLGGTSTQKVDDEDNNNSEQYKNDEFVVKDNQISSEDIFSNLGIDVDSQGTKYNVDTGNSEDNVLIINLSNPGSNTTKYEENNKDNYMVVETTGDNDNNILIIEKADDYNNDNRLTVDKGDDYNDNDESKLSAKVFSYTSEGWILPILIPWDELKFGSEGVQTIGYVDNFGSTSTKNGGITIIDDYADCMTPWGYKIVHGDSVLAYKQIDNTPDICNIERRFCWNGKLSGTYRQQGCSINKNYTYDQWGEAVVHTKKEETKSSVVQNPDGSVTVNKPLGTGSFVFDRPSQTSTPEYHVTNNVRDDDIDVDQTKRAHWNCTTPWGEEVKHGQFVQAFKHSNGFSDAPCIAQIRLCTMGELMGSYTQYSCKTRDTSLIDRINGSPTRDTFSEEKLEWVRKQIKTEEKNYNNARKNVKGMMSSNTTTDDILYILDQN